MKKSVSTTSIRVTMQVLMFSLIVFMSCEKRGKPMAPAPSLVDNIDLKRGKVISCGPPMQQFGSLTFEISCKEVQVDFNFAMMLLHSFEYDEAEKVFARIIDKDPTCAMAYWGVAMSNFHPLWTAPSETELEKGNKALSIAKTLATSRREDGYIQALASYFTNWERIDHRKRTVFFEHAMGKLYTKFPKDKETAILYALALTAAADPTDKTFAKQKKAGSILQRLSAEQPNHPGIVHYIIHAYDVPELAAIALPAARKYAAIAPSSSHALHMPSHIFTRLGLWDDCIRSNIAAVASARCYADSSGMQGHWDEELHGLDYLTYAYLQKGDNTNAKQQWAYLKTIREVSPMNLKVAYAFASIPSRYLLENKLWKQAAEVSAHLKTFDWKKFPWQNAILHFTRLMGSVNSGKMDAAKKELKILNQLKKDLVAERDVYKANQVDIQIKTSQAWILYKENQHDQALSMMYAAADLEDKTEKHPVTPGEVIPAREFLGDMLLAMNRPAEALFAYETNLKTHAKRFNGLYGAAISAQANGDLVKAKKYFSQLASYKTAGSARPEISEAKKFISVHSSLTTIN